MTFQSEASANTKHIGLLSIGMAVAIVFLAFCCTQLKASEVETTKLKVEKMTCPMCPITIRKSLENIEGVSNAEVSYDTKIATVTYDSGQTNVDALIQATTNVGYPSTEYRGERGE